MSAVVADTNVHLAVEAEAAVARIQPLAAGRRLVRLPALAFTIDVDARCSGKTVPGSMSISIADTRKTWTAAEFGEEAVTAAITIPASQVSPVAVDDFCGAQVQPDSQHELLVRDAMTAHLSLRCTSEEGDSITYISRSLHVLLLCETSFDDQEDSPVSTDR